MNTKSFTNCVSPNISISEAEINLNKNEAEKEVETTKEVDKTEEKRETPGIETKKKENDATEAMVNTTEVTPEVCAMQKK